MLFDERILQDGADFATRVWTRNRLLAPEELRDLVLSGFSGLGPTGKLQGREAPMAPGDNRILTAIAALDELDRLTGTYNHLPIRLADLMSHLLLAEPGDVIVCHGQRTLQFALWFASRGNPTFFGGDAHLLPHIRAVAEGEALPLEPGAPYPGEARHMTVETHNEELGAFMRRLDRSCPKGAVVMTNWSFLGATSPQLLSLKQRIIENGTLYSAVQLPRGLIPRTLPALLQLGPPAPARKVRLVDAKDWSIPGRGGMEVSYLDPILAQACDRPLGRLPPWTPKPAARALPREELVRLSCDLRLKHEHAPREFAGREETLGACAALVRGQMLARAGNGQEPQVFCEVTLADVDAYGLVTGASRLVDDAAPLPRARQVARLRPGDILLVCKGSLQSLGKVGLVTESEDNWLPSQTFYLIRSESLDPVWLFHYLRSPRAADYFRAHISGTSIPQIQAADIAALPVPLPDEESLEAVLAVHKKALRLAGKIGKLQAELENLLREPFGGQSG